MFRSRTTRTGFPEGTLRGGNRAFGGLASTAALAKRHFTVLKDQHTRVVIGGEPLDIAGIRFWTRRTEHVAAVLKGVTVGDAAVIGYGAVVTRDVDAGAIVAVAGVRVVGNVLEGT